MNGGIDLHMHTKYSDGTDSETELIKRLRKEGIDFFALTDHDTVNGVMKIKKHIPDDMRFIAGIEFSSMTADNGKVHLLGYDYDENNRDFLNAIEEVDIKRKKKLEKRLKHLKEDHGIVFSESDEDELRKQSSSGKPHLALMLMKNGYAKDKPEAIDKFIDDKKDKNDAINTRIPSKTAISGILSAGGIPVWAHPLGGIREKRLSESEFDSRLELLMKDGLRGLECWYSLYNEDEIGFLLDRAEKHGLLVSGGSDYHGKNKTVIPGELNSFGKIVYREMLTIVNEF